MCSSKSICAVLKTLMCSYQANENITLKYVCRFPVDAPENSKNAVIEHQKYKHFLGENPDVPPISFTKHLPATKPFDKTIKVGELNILPCLNCKLTDTLNIHNSSI
jgi:hypothetical protein